MTTYHAINITCPGCGAPVQAEDEHCSYCGRPLTITSFTSLSEMALPLVSRYADSCEAQANIPGKVLTSALCCLKLRLFDRALPLFDQAMMLNPNNSEAAFYYAVCLLRGKKAFLASLSDIRKAIDCVNAAIRIDPRGIYYYFLAYIKKDYFSRKHLKVSPDYQEELDNAHRNHVTKADIKILFDFLGVEIPEEIRI